MDKSVLTFPYRYKQIEYGKIFNPYVRIPVKTSFSWQDLWFLVDSGADTTMLTVSIADQLRLDIDKTKKTQLFGIGEKSVSAYPGKIMIKIGKYTVDLRIYFIDSEDTTLLLGRLDFFDRFNVCFDSKHEQVVFNRI